MAESLNTFNDELRTRLSIVDIIGRRVPLVKRGQNFWGCCPFHNEKTPSFSVSEQKGFYHCFGCGAHGDVISFVMQSENLPYIDAIRELANIAGMKMPEFHKKPADVIAREKSYTDIMAAARDVYATELFGPNGTTALSYIHARGFSDDTIKKYGLGYAPKSKIISARFAKEKTENLTATGLVRVGDYGPYDFFRDRLMFPIFDMHNNIVAFSGRSLDGSEPKYINTSDTEMFHKRQTIFGFNFARDAIYRANRTIIVEGQIDAIQMQTHGFPETVAPLGTALTSEHLTILCKSNRNIIFCFDGDNAGQKAAARAAGLIAPFLRENADVRFAFMTGGKDPDEVLRTDGGTQKMREIIDGATPFADFIWALANKNYLINTPGGRTAAEKFLAGTIDKITDTTLRTEYRAEYDKRKFNIWHKWKRGGDVIATAPVPNIDNLTRQTLAEIAHDYPDLIEKHSEFLVKIGADVRSDSDLSSVTSHLSRTDADKFIVTLKLKNYIKNLQADKKDLMARALNATESPAHSISDKIKFIDSEIIKSENNLAKLMNY